ncbi:hypothetical protein PV327_007504 [Microctonus hyperodae]|uniref:Uncharacterized protein n=1 Tax=Microctonus hyperodae TaxID=165561 RepID=A0AA39KYI8_MICHY|nr:hypothetical protein PV327_007504 [Microctonus hyperodae]
MDVDDDDGDGSCESKSFPGCVSTQASTMRTEGGADWRLCWYRVKAKQLSDAGAVFFCQGFKRTAIGIITAPKTNGPLLNAFRLVLETGSSS